MPENSQSYSHPYKERFQSLIEQLASEGRYRVFRTINRKVGDFPRASWEYKGQIRDVVIWCSNDYLGMGHHPDVLAAAERAISEFGAGAGGTRNISGTHGPIVALEAALARTTGKQAALVFSSGFLANETALSTLARALPEVVIVSDELNHASMIEGMRLGRSIKKVFKHNDLAHLEQILSEIPERQPRIIAFESIYSMEGDTAPIKEICAIARRYNALSYLDETHAAGLYGLAGGGLAQERQLSDQVDIIQGGLGKAFGVIGGFIASSAVIIDVVRSYGSGFIFTTALPPACAAAALKSVQCLFHSSEERAAHRQVVRETKQSLRRAGIEFWDGGTHIIPIIIGESTRCKWIADWLLEERGIYIQPINYPTVPRGTERLRVTPTPFHTPEMIEHLTESLCQAMQIKDFDISKKIAIGAQASV